MNGQTRASRIARRAATGFLTVALGGCGVVDNLISVDSPSRVIGERLADPSAAGLLLASAITDFECALSRYVVAAGLFGDEFADSQTSSIFGLYDGRQVGTSSLYSSGTCNDAATVYKPLSAARWQADNILGLLEGWTDAQVANRTAMIATAAAYSGYSHTLMGEAMCSAAFDLGPEQTPAQTFQRSEERFTRALAAAQTAANPEYVNMSRLGRARARLNLGRAADAAVDARLIPPGFVKNANYSSVSLRTENTVFVANSRLSWATVGDLFRDVRFLGVRDPRVDVIDAGRPGAHPQVRLWLQRKYAAPTSSVPIATTEEAQLIIAEAELAAGNLQAAVNVINTFHTQLGLPPFASSNATEIKNQIIYERRAELFLESHHLGDNRRYNLPLIPAPGTPYSYGGLYTDLRCFPLPDIERFNNPNIG